jgi:hypothetical protein
MKYIKNILYNTVFAAYNLNLKFIKQNFTVKMQNI